MHWEDRHQEKTNILTACAGFLKCQWPKDLEFSDSLVPSGVNALTEAAKAEGDRAVEPILDLLKSVARVVCFGVDLWDGEICRAQLVCVRNLHSDTDQHTDTDQVKIVGKSYPTEGERKNWSIFQPRTTL